MPDALTPDDRRKLTGILGRLGSDHDGERAAAGLLASRLLRERGLTWGDLLAPAPCRASRTPPPPRSPSPPPPPGISWRADLGLVLRHLNRVTEWEARFAADLRRERRQPTARQQAKLAQIATDLRLREYA